MTTDIPVVRPEAQKRRDEFADYLETYVARHPERFNYRFPVVSPARREPLRFAELQSDDPGCGTVGCIAGHYMAKFYPHMQYVDMANSSHRQLLYDAVEKGDAGLHTFPGMQILMSVDMAIPFDILSAITVAPHCGRLDGLLIQEELAELLAPVIHYLRTGDSTRLRGDWTRPVRAKYCTRNTRNRQLNATAE